jgi:hypothetical protein
MKSFERACDGACNGRLRWGVQWAVGGCRARVSRHSPNHVHSNSENEEDEGGAAARTRKRVGYGTLDVGDVEGAGLFCI